MTTIAIHQPQYLPWLGYFDKIYRADLFVLLDNVQFKKNEWQNRNKIKTAQGWQWITVPVKYKFPQKINEVAINNEVKWQHKQKQAIITNYRKAPCYRALEDFFQELFSKTWESISRLNIVTIRRLVEFLGIKTPLLVASKLGQFPEDPDERIIAIAKHLGASTYLAGSGGKRYMDLGKYEESGINVAFQDYVHPRYGQLFSGFEPYMSIIDLILNHGDQSLAILKGG